MPNPNHNKAVSDATAELHRHLQGAIHAAAKLRVTFDQYTPDAVREKHAAITTQVRAALAQAERTFQQRSLAVGPSDGPVALVQRVGTTPRLFVHGVVVPPTLPTDAEKLSQLAEQISDAACAEA
jgi:hypothetical protein